MTLKSSGSRSSSPDLPLSVHPSSNTPPPLKKSPVNKSTPLQNVSGTSTPIGISPGSASIAADLALASLFPAHGHSHQQQKRRPGHHLQHHRNGSPTSSPKRKSPPPSDTPNGPHSNPNVVSAIESRMRQLQLEAANEEEEERQIAKQVGRLTKEFSSLLANVEQPEGKSAVQIKYAAVCQDKEKMFRENLKLRQRIQTLESERDSAKSDLSRTSGQRQRLESLCRELTKENHRVKEQSKEISQREQEKREALGAKFETAIQEIKRQMSKDAEEQRRRALENETLRTKFQEFVQQHELSQKNMDALLHTKDLELELSIAKQQKAESLLSEYKDSLISMEKELSASKKTELELRDELALYSSKFKEVEVGLAKSNELFLAFRNKMDELTKRTKTMEKENAVLTGKYATTNTNLISMIEERNSLLSKVDNLNTANKKLKDLCRALQTERTQLETKLKATESNETLVPSEEDFSVSETRSLAIQDGKGQVESC